MAFLRGGDPTTLGGRGDRGGASAERREVSDQLARSGLRRHRLDGGVVVGVGVGVISQDATVCRLDELDAADHEVVAPREVLESRDHGVVKIHAEAEQLLVGLGGDRRAGGMMDFPVFGVGRAGVRRAQLESAAGRVRLDRADEPAAYDFGPTAATIRGVSMPAALKAVSWSTLLISSSSTRRPFTVLRPWASSQERTHRA